MKNNILMSKCIHISSAQNGSGGQIDRIDEGHAIGSNTSAGIPALEIERPWAASSRSFASKSSLTTELAADVWRNAE
jgi:hypothetical protein